MEERFLCEWAALSRSELDRLFKSYRRICVAYSSARRDSRVATLGLGGIVCSEVYRMRELILLLDDPIERELLYRHYVEGLTLERSGEKLFLSLRTATRVKGRGLDNILNTLAATAED